jgi:hypothetical protein
MPRVVDQSSREVIGQLNDGSRQVLKLNLEERIEGDMSVYSIGLECGSRVMVGTSPDGYFDALKELRIELEQIGILLVCFGASKDVYPSPMQVSMGPAELAYRTRLGEQTEREDIVNIFDYEESVRPATVEQQEKFHQEWLRGFK